MARSSRSFSTPCRDTLSLQLKLTDSLDPDPRGAAREVAQRHLLNIDHMDRLPVSAGGDGFVNCLLFGLCEGLVARLFLQREDPVYLATHLSDRRADRVGDREMLWLDQLRSARQAITQQDAAAANLHDWDRLRACLRSVDPPATTILHHLDPPMHRLL